MFSDSMYVCFSLLFFFFKQKTAYDMRISDWSSDVCSSDLPDCGDSFTMNNEVAVVVGAAGAIGSVITEQLVTAGLVVVAVGRDADKLQQLAQRHDDMVIPYVADIASDAAIAVIGEQIKGQIGRAQV